MLYTIVETNYSSWCDSGATLRIFKTKWMTRFAPKLDIDDALLVEAIGRAGKGLIDADLGGGLIKQRIARRGQGRSGGYRTLIAIRVGDRAFILYAFAKNEQENISANVLSELKDIARVLLSADDAGLRQILEDGEVEEIKSGKGQSENDPP
jgi:hypothetical protein